MRKKFKEIFGKTDDVIRQYPLVLVMSLLAAISLICMTERNLSQEDEFLFGKISLVFILGISLTFALNILSQRIGKIFLLQLVGITFLIFFYFLLPVKEKNFTEQYAFLLIPIFILSHLLVSFIAFYGQKKEMSFWQYNKNLFINIFLTAVFTGVLIAGVQLAIVAVDQLFDFNFKDDYYRNPFIILSVFGSSFIFLLFNVNGLQDLEKDGNYPQILKFFTQYILIPLLLIYAVILYFYSAKILLNWELPRGWVSYLVLAYSVVGIFALLLVYPLKEEFSKSWVKIFSKIFYFTLLPLLILLFTAIFTRILQYGYTEPRYFVLLLALWLSTVVVYFILKKKSNIKFVPVSLFFFGLFALAFPYMNTFSVAKRSQKTELNKILKENKLVLNGKIDFNKKVADSVATEISDKFEFLAKRHEEIFLKSFLNPSLQDKFIKEAKEGKFYNLERTIKGEFKNISAESFAKGTRALPNIRTLYVNEINSNISGYQYLFKAYNFKNNDFQLGTTNINIKLPANDSKNEFYIKINGTKTDLMRDFQQIFYGYPERGETEVKELTFKKNIGNYEVRFLLDNISRTNFPNNKKQYFINSESVLILIKEN